MLQSCKQLLCINNSVRASSFSQHGEHVTLSKEMHSLI